MSGARPFRDVKLQWLQQLSCDKVLRGNARSVALSIVTTHLNSHTEKVWLLYQTIADATGKSVKTIQRAIRELETRGWFEIWRGNGIGHNAEYRPSVALILRASDAREKTDKVVTLYSSEGGQTRPARRSDVSTKPRERKKYKPNPREDAPPRVETRRAVPLVLRPRPRRSRSSSGAAGSVVMAFRHLKLLAFGQRNPASPATPCRVTGRRKALQRWHGSHSSGTVKTTWPNQPTACCSGRLMSASSLKRTWLTYSVKSP